MNNTSNKILDHAIKMLALFIIGGFIYLGIELLWRGHTHWTMGIVGGLCFIIVGLINELFTYDMYLEVQAIIASVVITVIEFVAGLIINVHFGLDVWDYSDLPFNIMGQICLLFMILWFFLSFVAIILDDIIRSLIFEEEKPVYKVWIINKVKKLLDNHCVKDGE